MNLEGSLDAFGLTDVFALLAMTGKSGGLRLRNTGGPIPIEGVVWFHDGRVTGATADRSRLGLVRRVVGSGAVDDAALGAAVNRAATSPIGVARALLEAGAVEPDILQEAAVDQAVDAVFDLTRWEHGDFGFDPGVRNYDDVGLALDHAWLMAEAKARAVQWVEIRSVVPSDSSVPTVPVVLDSDPIVTRDDWALLALVDGRRTVADLIELTGCGNYAVASVLAGLVRRGLLAIRAEDSTDHVEVVQRRMALLTPLEIPAVVAPEEPEIVPAPAAVEPVAAQGNDPIALSGAQALAVARAAQGLSGPGLRDAPSSSPQPAPVRGDVERPAARHEVVPPRPEPFLPERRPQHPEGNPFVTTADTSLRPPSGTAATFSAMVNTAAPSPMAHATVGGTSGNAAMAAPALRRPPSPDLHTGEQSIIERDPAMNRSLLLRLIAGVRGL